MQTALIREYPKSVDLHTPSHLHTWSRATGIKREGCDEAIGSALLWWNTVGHTSTDRFLVLQYEGGRCMSNRE
jgi:hypothetical protein